MRRTRTRSVAQPSAVHQIAGKAKTTSTSVILLILFYANEVELQDSQAILLSAHSFLACFAHAISLVLSLYLSHVLSLSPASANENA